MSAHTPTCRTVGVSFTTLAFEALSGMSEATTTSLSRNGRLLGQRLGVSPADSICHLFQCCSVSLWGGNAALWLHRFPIGPPSIDIIIFLMFGIVFLSVLFFYLLFFFLYSSYILLSRFILCTSQYNYGIQ